jgi:hypothetical protein
MRSYKARSSMSSKPSWMALSWLREKPPNTCIDTLPILRDNERP